MLDLHLKQNIIDVGMHLQNPSKHVLNETVTLS